MFLIKPLGRRVSQRVSWGFLSLSVRPTYLAADSSRVGTLQVGRNRLEGRAGKQKAVAVEGQETPELLPVSLLIWSIGFLSVHPDPHLSLYLMQRTGEFVTEKGRIELPRMTVGLRVMVYIHHTQNEDEMD